MIPDGSDLHPFAITWPGGLDVIASAAKKLSGLDTYIGIGAKFAGLTGEHSKETVGSWAIRLLSLIREKFQPRIAGLETIVQLDLESMLKKHMSMGNLNDA